MTGADGVFEQLGPLELTAHFAPDMSLGDREDRLDTSGFTDVDLSSQPIRGAQDVTAKSSFGVPHTALGPWGSRLQPVHEREGQLPRFVFGQICMLFTHAKQGPVPVIDLRPVHQRDLSARRLWQAVSPRADPTEMPQDRKSVV